MKLYYNYMYTYEYVYESRKMLKAICAVKKKKERKKGWVGMAVGSVIDGGRGEVVRGGGVE
jgi:hypothetical protein